jgi:hypothetical protein
MLLIDEGNVPNGFGTGFLADSVSTHSIGHNKYVPIRLKPSRIHGGLGSTGILVVTTFHSHIRESGVPNGLKCRHKRPPREDSLITYYPISDHNGEGLAINLSFQRLCPDLLV